MSARQPAPAPGAIPVGLAVCIRVAFRSGLQDPGCMRKHFGMALAASAAQRTYGKEW